MKVGNLVKMKGPRHLYSWRQGASPGVGIVINASHRTERTMKACSVYWSSSDRACPNSQTVQEIVEEWLEVIG